jgi:hypothetical protein
MARGSAATPTPGISSATGVVDVVLTLHTVWPAASNGFADAGAHRPRAAFIMRRRNRQTVGIGRNSTVTDSRLPAERAAVIRIALFADGAQAATRQGEE